MINRRIVEFLDSANRMLSKSGLSQRSEKAELMRAID